MTGMELVHACVTAANNLDELKMLLSHLPVSQHAFVYRSIPEVTELLGIGRYETTARVTPMQAKHIGRILKTIVSLYACVPQDVLDALRAADT